MPLGISDLVGLSSQIQMERHDRILVDLEIGDDYTTSFPNEISVFFFLLGSCQAGFQVLVKWSSPVNVTIKQTQ